MVNDKTPAQKFQEKQQKRRERLAEVRRGRVTRARERGVPQARAGRIFTPRERQLIKRARAAGVSEQEISKVLGARSQTELDVALQGISQERQTESQRAAEAQRRIERERFDRGFESERLGMTVIGREDLQRLQERSITREEFREEQLRFPVATLDPSRVQTRRPVPFAEAFREAEFGEAPLGFGKVAAVGREFRERAEPKLRKAEKGAFRVQERTISLTGEAPRFLQPAVGRGLSFIEFGAGGVVGATQLGQAALRRPVATAGIVAGGVALAAVAPPVAVGLFGGTAAFQFGRETIRTGRPAFAAGQLAPEFLVGGAAFRGVRAARIKPFINLRIVSGAPRVTARGPKKGFEVFAFEGPKTTATVTGFRQVGVIETPRFRQLTIGKREIPLGRAKPTVQPFKSEAAVIDIEGLPVSIIQTQTRVTTPKGVAFARGAAFAERGKQPTVIGETMVSGPAVGPKSILFGFRQKPQLRQPTKLGEAQALQLQRGVIGDIAGGRQPFRATQLIEGAPTQAEFQALQLQKGVPLEVIGGEGVPGALLPPVKGRIKLKPTPERPIPLDIPVEQLPRAIALELRPKITRIPKRRVGKVTRAERRAIDISLEQPPVRAPRKEPISRIGLEQPRVRKRVPIEGREGVEILRTATAAEQAGLATALIQEPLALRGFAIAQPVRGIQRQRQRLAPPALRLAPITAQAQIPISLQAPITATALTPATAQSFMFVPAQITRTTPRTIPRVPLIPFITPALVPGLIPPTPTPFFRGVSLRDERGRRRKLPTQKLRFTPTLIGLAFPALGGLRPAKGLQLGFGIRSPTSRSTQRRS